MMNLVLDFWCETFSTELIENTDDQLALKVCQKGPFQDDPTRKAPYLILSIDEEKGMIPDNKDLEVGGGIPWTVYLKVRAAPKVVNTAEKAYTLVDLLAHRILHVIQVHSFVQPSIAGVSFVQNYDQLNIDKLVPKVYGGEREWLSYVEVYFHTRIKQPRNPVYPVGNLDEL